MVKLLEILEQVEPASVRVASLALKRTPKSIGYIPGMYVVKLTTLWLFCICILQFRD